VKKGTLIFLVCSIGTASACGGTPDAQRNVVFYDYKTLAAGGGAVAAALLEKPYPPLNLGGSELLPEYLGKLVLLDGIRISRPRDWMIREASIDPGHAYIQYISPKAYSFALYERPDPPTALWRDVLSHYEDDIGAVQATIVGKRVPFAAFRGQGRAYTVQRKIDAAKRPLISNAREILLRGDHRVVLVQIVHEGNDLSGVDQELMRTLTTLEVL
jgi:hypothetical protein